ncbi:hypothetical protein FQZ97_672900 [compost metagenome]
MDARPLALALARELGIAGLDAGFGRALKTTQEIGSPGRNTHVLLPPCWSQAGFTMLAVVGQPALEGALGQAAVAGVAIIGPRHAFCQVGAKFAVSGQADQGFDGALLADHPAHALDLTDEGQAGSHH